MSRMRSIPTNLVSVEKSVAFSSGARYWILWNGEIYGAFRNYHAIVDTCAKKYFLRKPDLYKMYCKLRDIL